MKLSKPLHLPGNPKPFARVVPPEAQHPSVKFRKLTDVSMQVSNTQETDNQVVDKTIRQAEHPSVAFRQITTAQRDKAELERKLNYRIDKVKKLGEEVNEDVKDIIKEAEKSKRGKLNDPAVNKVNKISNKINQIKDLHARVDVKPLNDAVQYLKTQPAHPRVRLTRLMHLFNLGLNKTVKKENIPLVKKQKEDDDDIIYLKTQPVHPRVRMERAAKKNLDKAIKQAVAEIEARDDEPVCVKTTPSHPRQRLQRNARALNEKAAKQAAAEIDKRERFEKRMAKIKQPKVYLEPDVMRELPNFNSKIIVTKTSLVGRDNQIYNGIIKQLPPNKDQYYINYDEEHDAYIVRKER